MGVGCGLYIYDVVVKHSRSLSHLLMSSCYVSIMGLTLCCCFYIYILYVSMKSLSLNSDFIFPTESKINISVGHIQPIYFICHIYFI